MAKKCPFRKHVEVVNDHHGVQFVPVEYITNFDDCIEDECMAWCGGPDDKHVPYVYNFCELTKGKLDV